MDPWKPEARQGTPQGSVSSVCRAETVKNAHNTTNIVAAFRGMHVSPAKHSYV